MHREHKQREIRPASFDVLDQFKAIAAAQGDVHERNVRVQHAHCFKGLRRFLRLTTYDEVRLLVDEFSEALA